MLLTNFIAVTTQQKECFVMKKYRSSNRKECKNETLNVKLLQIKTISTEKRLSGYFKDFVAFITIVVYI